MTLSRAAMLAYGVVGYAVFLVALVWTIAFLADLDIAPTTVDSRVGDAVAVALGVDAGLLLLFAVQHTTMARRGVKRALRAVVPPPAERSTFVLAASLVLLLLLWQWRAVPDTLWQVDGLLASVLWAAYVVGWGITVSATFMIDHWDFLGVAQAGAYATGRDHRPPEFREQFLYRWVRHPMMLGMLLAFWATPRMTIGHLAFAGAATAYIVVGLQFEERELAAEHGARYVDYVARVPALVPGARAVRDLVHGTAEER